MGVKRILVIGSANVDIVLRMPAMPRIGETVFGKSIVCLPGGKGANQAYAVGRLGGAVAFAGVVGDDEGATLLLDSLKKANVVVGVVGQVPDVPTGTAVIEVDQFGGNRIVVIPGANATCNKRYLAKLRPLIEECDLLLVQLEIPTEGVYWAIQTAAAKGKMVILNPAPVPQQPLPEGICRCVDYLIPNESELISLTGVREGEPDWVHRGCGIMQRRGVSNVLVTLGAEGAALCTASEFSLFPPPSIPVVDTTAAGDTFCGAFALRLAEGASPEEAIRFANAAAALAVSRPGAQVSIPDRQEVCRFLKSQ